MIAIIGVKSNIPIGGMKRRNIRRYGSQTSRRKFSTASTSREYGGRTPNENIRLSRM